MCIRDRLVVTSNHHQFIFGLHGNETFLAAADDGSSGEVNLSTPFVFYGSPQTSLFVSCKCATHGLAMINVTGFWKTLRMGFFVKIEFDVSLISPSLELIHLQV